MEDWQHHSLEEKVDLENLVLLPSDSYSNEGFDKYSCKIKEEPVENSIVIDNSDHTEIKTEKIESDEQEIDANEFSTCKIEICQICGLEFGSNAGLKNHNSLIHPDDDNDDGKKAGRHAII